MTKKTAKQPAKKETAKATNKKGVQMVFRGQYIFGDRQACHNFTPKPTNGDIIKKSGNVAIAEISWSDPCLHCAYSSGKCKRPVDKTCKDGMLAWLNTPAESEVEDETE